MATIDNNIKEPGLGHIKTDEEEEDDNDGKDVPEEIQMDGRRTR